jgi:Transposase DDE domain
MSGIVKREDYCQFLLVTQTNYTLTYFANHSQNFSHDAPTRYLRRDRVTAKQIWIEAKRDLVVSHNGFIIFDDSILDKNHSRHIQLVYQQFSGNEHRVIRGIGLINCVYVNPETNEFWVIDYRIFNPSTDGKDKHQHVRDMLNACFEKCAREELAFKAVLMDTWYATTKLMLEIHRSERLFYCPIKPNRRVSELKEGQKYAYQSAESVTWTLEEADFGKRVHLKEFPAGLELKLFRIATSAGSTELIVTNDESSLDAEAVREAQGFRWKVEQLHREVKQVTGIEACECRSARAQRNHVGCALLVWTFLKRQARLCFSTVYALKQGLLDEYMRKELKSPSIRFTA